MGQGHIPTDSVFEIVDGREPSSSEIEHLQGCSDCREVLSLIKRQERGSGRSRKRVETDHVPIVRLFRFAQGADLKDSELKHLFECEQCSGALWICRAAKSLIPVIQIMKEKGLKVE